MIRLTSEDNDNLLNVLEYKDLIYVQDSPAAVQNIARKFVDRNYPLGPREQLAYIGIQEWWATVQERENF